MYISAAVETDAARAEPLSEALLEQGALSVSVEDADAGTERETPQFGEPGHPAAPLWDRSRVVALFEPGDDLIGRIAAAAHAVGLDDLPDIDLQEVGDQDWVRLTQSQFDPIQIHDRLWIVPSWHHAPNPEAINLVLDPGLAFGTGSHPTTRLCLEWLCQNTVKDATVLDYGCGSGILAIAAAKLGAGRVVGVDIDDKALDATAANAENNGVAVECRHSRQPLTETFDIVVANILTNPLCVLAPLLAGRVAPGGRLILSGILDSQIAQVTEAYAPWIAMTPGALREGWVRLEGQRC